jgi:all-trans-retinol dehydrogenase (NAD+)
VNPSYVEQHRIPHRNLASNVHYYKADISKSSEISTIAKVIRKEYGDPTVLINNAGIAVCRPILSETEEQIRRAFDVNTIAHFLIVKEFVPAMVQQNHGHIVTVASMSSYSVHAQNIDYSCSKASALAFHEGLAQEIKSRYSAPKVRTT